MDVSGDAAAAETLPAVPSTAASRLHLGDSGAASELIHLGSIMEAPTDESVVTPTSTGAGHGLADSADAAGDGSGAGERRVSFAAAPAGRVHRK